MDLMIYESGNGGDLSLKNGDLETIQGLTNQPYLAHFAGNIEANTTGEEITGEERADWFGNSYFLNDLEGQMNSDLERALANNELSSKGRVEIERAAVEDLKYLQTIGVTETVATILSDKRISISDKIIEPTKQFKFSFIWEATKNELIEHKII